MRKSDCFDLGNGLWDRNLGIGIQNRDETWIQIQEFIKWRPNGRQILLISPYGRIMDNNSLPKNPSQTFFFFFFNYYLILLVYFFISFFEKEEIFINIVSLICERQIRKIN